MKRQPSGGSCLRKAVDVVAEYGDRMAVRKPNRQRNEDRDAAGGTLTADDEMTADEASTDGGVVKSPEHTSAVGDGDAGGGRHRQLLLKSWP